MLVNSYEMPFIGLILGLNFVIVFMFFYVGVKVGQVERTELILVFRSI